MLQRKTMTSYHSRTSSSASLAVEGYDEPSPRNSSSRNHQSGGARAYSYTSYRESINSRSPKKKMTNTVRASNKAAILAVGEELRQLLHEEDPPLIKDRRYHLKVYEKCFIGVEMVDWLLRKGEVESRSEAVAMMQKLLDNGVVHHVCDDHTFKDEKLFYRFRKDDGSYVEPFDSAILARGQRLYSRVKGDGSNLVHDRKYHLTTYKQCFIGKEFVDWLVANGEASSRTDAIEIGRKLLEAGVFKHVCEDHHFKDEGLFYRFKNDEKHKSPKIRDRLNSKKGSKYGKEQRRGEEDLGSTGDQNEHRESGGSWDSSTTSEPHTPQGGTPDLDEYVHMQSSNSNVAASPAPQHSPTIANSYPGPASSGSTASPHLQSRPAASSVSAPSGSGRVKPTIDELMDPSGRFSKKSINVVSDPVGYGFVIRGSRPVYVHTIDPSGPAAGAGLRVGEYLYSVNGQMVLNASHTDAARIILMGSSTAALVVFTEKSS